MTNASQSNGNNDINIADSFSQFAKVALTSENFEAAGRFTKEKAIELKTQAQEGDRSLRLLALVGGVGSIIVGLFELISRISTLQLVDAIIDVYIIFLGSVVVVLEGKDIFLSKRLIQNLNKYALFLKFLWGRGSLYFICGTLQLTQIDLLNLLAGGYMCMIGILCIVVGNNTAKKLKAIRKSIYSDSTLQSKFQAANIHGDGLTVKEFRSLCEDLGLDFTSRETEAVFGCIQRIGDDTNDKLGYQEFKAWWDDLESDGQIDDNAFIFV